MQKSGTNEYARNVGGQHAVKPLRVCRIIVVVVINVVVNSNNMFPELTWVYADGSTKAACWRVFTPLHGRYQQSPVLWDFIPVLWDFTPVLWVFTPVQCRYQQSCCRTMRRRPLSPSYLQSLLSCCHSTQPCHWVLVHAPKLHCLLLTIIHQYHHQQQQQTAYND